MMTPDSPQPAQPNNDVPAFPHKAAPPQSPLEFAERQYADRPEGAPNWQPEDGDFT
jgi:hypothetical protein